MNNTKLSLSVLMVATLAACGGGGGGGGDAPPAPAPVVSVPSPAPIAAPAPAPTPVVEAPPVVTAPVTPVVVTPGVYLGVPYTSSKGLSVTVLGYTVTDLSNGYTRYTLLYREQNDTSTAIDEGTFSLYLENGKKVQQNGTFGGVLPGAASAIQRQYSWDLKNEDKPLMLEFDNDPFASLFTPDKPRSTIQWKLPLLAAPAVTPPSPTPVVEPPPPVPAPAPVAEPPAPVPAPPSPAPAPTAPPATPPAPAPAPAPATPPSPAPAPAQVPGGFQRCPDGTFIPVYVPIEGCSRVVPPAPPAPAPSPTPAPAPAPVLTPPPPGTPPAQTAKPGDPGFVCPTAFCASLVTCPDGRQQPSYIPQEQLCAPFGTGPAYAYVTCPDGRLLPSNQCTTPNVPATNANQCSNLAGFVKPCDPRWPYPNKLPPQPATLDQIAGFNANCSTVGCLLTVCPDGSYLIGTHGSTGGCPVPTAPAPAAPVASISYSMTYRA